MFPLNSNSTSTALENSQFFTGDWYDCTKHTYPSLVSIAVTDQTGILYVEFSTDGVNVDDSYSYAVGAAVAQTVVVTIAARYGRVRFLNDSGSNQSYLRIQTSLTDGSNAYLNDAELSALAGLVSAADTVPYFTGSGTAALATFTSFARSLVAAVSQAAARLTLGLGSIATQDSSNVSVTGGSITGITDLAIADGGTGASTAAGARTNLELGSMATQSASSVAITGGSVTGITDLAVADGGTGASTQEGARSNLGLGTMATQNSASVSISGGSITGITDLAVADGGTGASTASDARTNLGLGTAATQNTGTSGANVPLLNGTNTWSENNYFSANVGVGTTSPSNALEVSSNTATQAVLHRATSSTQSQVGMKFTALNASSAIADYARIDCRIISNTAGTETGALAFWVSTGTGSLVEAGRINENGYFGLGSILPSSVLHVQRENSTTWSTSWTTASTQSYTPFSHELTLRNDTNNTTGTMASIMFRPGQTGVGSQLNAARIAAIREASDSATSLVFATRAASGGNMTEHLRINATGNVGIGTSSQSTKLHVEGPIRVKTYTVATLPSASTVGAGARAAVTDANATTFNSTVAGGGANFVPVISNGTNWLIG